MNKRQRWYNINESHTDDIEQEESLSDFSAPRRDEIADALKLTGLQLNQRVGLWRFLTEWKAVLIVTEDMNGKILNASIDTLIPPTDYIDETYSVFEMSYDWPEERRVITNLISSEAVALIEKEYEDESNTVVSVYNPSPAIFQPNFNILSVLMTPLTESHIDSDEQEETLSNFNKPLRNIIIQYIFSTFQWDDVRNLLILFLIEQKIQLDVDVGGYVRIESVWLDSGTQEEGHINISGDRADFVYNQLKKNKLLKVVGRYNSPLFNTPHYIYDPSINNFTLPKDLPPVSLNESINTEEEDSLSNFETPLLQEIDRFIIQTMPPFERNFAHAIIIEGVSMVVTFISGKVDVIYGEDSDFDFDLAFNNIQGPRRARSFFKLLNEAGLIELSEKKTHPKTVNTPMYVECIYKVSSNLAKTFNIEASPMYIKDVKMYNESMDNDEEDTTSQFAQPGRMNLVEQIANAPNYFEAWKLFKIYVQDWSEIQKENIEDDEPNLDSDPYFIPFGRGSFERWWMGNSDEGYGPPPSKEITIEDIHKIASTGSDGLEELGDMVANIFYNKSLGDLPSEVIKEICKLIMSSNKDSDDDLKDYVLEKILGSPELKAQQVTRALLQAGVPPNAEIAEMLQAYAGGPGAEERIKEINKLKTNPEAFDAAVDQAIAKLKAPKRKTRKKEAMEINPTTGYISDEESPVKKYLDSENISQGKVEEDPGIENNEESTEEFPDPQYPIKAVAPIANATTYVEALKQFKNWYKDIKLEDRRGLDEWNLIPCGSGAFEDWWCGKEPEEGAPPPAPRRTITTADIAKLSSQDALSLFSNVFYSSTELYKLPTEVLVALFVKSIDLADSSGTLEETESYGGDDYLGISLAEISDALENNTLHSLAKKEVLKLKKERGE